MRKTLPINNMQVKLMLLFLVFALVPLCAVGVLSIGTAEELILSMDTNQIEHVLADKTVLLERWITERKADIEVIAGSSILRSMDPGQIAPYLDLVRNKYRVYGDISVLSLDGSTVCRSSGHAPVFMAGFYHGRNKMMRSQRLEYDSANAARHLLCIASYELFWDTAKELSESGWTCTWCDMPQDAPLLLKRHWVKA